MRKITIIKNHLNNKFHHQFEIVGQVYIMPNNYKAYNFHCEVCDHDEIIYVNINELYTNTGDIENISYERNDIFTCEENIIKSIIE